jgi:lipopolysaccharide export system protein LptA
MTFAKCAMALFAGIFLWPLASAAQSLDSQAPIVIDADSGVRNERTGVTEYIGNVNISRGDLSITALLVENQEQRAIGVLHMHDLLRAGVV